MAPSQLQCQGCNKVFSYHGLTLHIAKMERPLCRVVNAALQAPTILQSFPIAGHPLISDLNPIPPGPSGAFLGDDASLSQVCSSQVVRSPVQITVMFYGLVVIPQLIHTFQMTI